MNKNLYRLIFSKTKGMLVAVAEFTRSQRAEAGATQGVNPRAQRISQLSAVSFGIMLALGSVQTARANIVADAGALAGQQPGIITNQGGATQIDIQTPSAAGVSRNVYSEFNVGQQGVILNNSQHGAMTQLAGQIAGNEALAQGAAKIILNEVNSANSSQLNGMIEVAGQTAQVIIANPSGIVCDGCGFINAGRATLTTGEVQLENGALAGYLVNDGEIIVQGAGMDSSAQNYTDIIARSVKINANLQARDLKIVTGRNQVDADNQQIIGSEDKADVTPALALDVSSLGGMYAGKITLVGTEKGVGVNNAGTVYASAGAIALNAKGEIVNTGELRSNDDITLAAESVSNSGNGFISAEKTTINVSDSVKNVSNGYIYGKDDVLITARDIINEGAIASDFNMDLEAGDSLINQGHINSYVTLNVSAEKDIVNDGVLESGALIKLAAEKITNSADIRSEMMLDINADQLDNRGGNIIAENYAKISAERIYNENGYIGATNNLNLKVAELENKNGAIYSGEVALSGSTKEIVEKDPQNQDYYYEWSRDTGIDKLLDKVSRVTGISKATLEDSVEQMHDDLRKTGTTDAEKYLPYLKAQLTGNSKASSEAIVLLINTMMTLWNQERSLPAIPAQQADSEMTETLPTTPDSDEAIDVPEMAQDEATVDVPEAAESEEAVDVPEAVESEEAIDQPGVTDDDDNVADTGVIALDPDGYFAWAAANGFAEEANRLLNEANIEEMFSVQYLELLFRELALYGTVNVDNLLKSFSLHSQLYHAETIRALASLMTHYVNAGNGAPEAPEHEAIIPGNDPAGDGDLADIEGVTEGEKPAESVADEDVAEAPEAIADEDVAEAPEAIADEDVVEAPEAIADEDVAEAPEATESEEAMQPAMDLSDTTVFDSWKSANSVYQQIKSTVETKAIPATVLRDMLNYMYLVLADDKEITEEIIQSWTQAAWGMGSNKENLATVQAIANIMTAQWSAPEQEVIPPKETEVIEPAEVILPDPGDAGLAAFEKWNASTDATEKVLSVISQNQLGGRGVQGKSFFLSGVMNSMYHALSEGYELTPELVEAIARNAWGLGVNNENIMTTMTIANTMTESWAISQNQ